MDTRLKEIRAELECEAIPRLAEMHGRLAEIQDQRSLAAVLGRGDLEDELGSMESSIQAAITSIQALLQSGERVQVDFGEPTGHQVPDLPRDDHVTASPQVQVASDTPADVKVEPPAHPTADSARLDVRAPAPAPETKLDRKHESRAFTKAQQDFFAQESLSVAQKLDPVPAKLKSLLCTALGLIRWAQDLGQDDSNLLHSAEDLAGRFERAFPGCQFFALNTARTHAREIWFELSDAYRLFPVAADCLTWLESTVIHEDERKELVSRCAATESLLMRIAFDHGLNFTEHEQKVLHERCVTLSGELYVPWWELSLPSRRKLEEIRKHALELPGHFEAVKVRIDKREKREAGLAALEQLGVSIADDSPFTGVLEAVRECLNSGTPPSDKKLVAFCVPYRAALFEESPKEFAKLLEYVDKVIAKPSISMVAEREKEFVEDEEYEAKLKRVRELLDGKVVLFMGGHRIPEKQAQIKLALGLEELLWPDADPSTKAGSFETSVSKADVVCYLIRWSRKGYKAMIDRAKAQNKQTVIVKAGIGVHRFVHDVFDQLVSPNPTASNAP